MKWLIFNPISGKPWNGLTIYTEPLGGSEAASVYSARELVRQGHQVVVVSHGQAGVYDGVQYVNHHAIPTEPVDVLLVTRQLEALKIEIQAKYRIFLAHDMPQAGGRYEIHANEVWFISEFQRNAWGVQSDYWVTSDGYDPAVFRPGPGYRERDLNKLVWVSNPDRGLPIALRIFQDLRKRWPDLELHIYGRSAVYGWPDTAEAPYMFHKSSGLWANVKLHKALPRPRLARELQEAIAVFYPTFWPETFCMATLEAQACGTPVIASPIGALPETVVGGILTNDFLNALSQLRNASRWEKLATAGIDHARQYTWERVVGTWIERLGRGGWDGGPKDVVPEVLGAQGEGGQLEDTEHRVSE